MDEKTKKKLKNDLLLWGVVIVGAVLWMVMNVNVYGGLSLGSVLFPGIFGVIGIYGFVTTIMRMRG